ncbi:DUF2795 domain-containing protein [Ktedonobacter racemifer]|uniref:DUF2795 domain-containing protein n=1 Tax=Ktedonobacter racemifer TaxID=363277 RepID=UPI00030BDABA|nr:DUF2795 domain-containing protein [Ktedonobacter racemifer]
MDYPASKKDLINHVKQESKEVLDALQQLPDETFQRPTDVNKAIGEISRESR